MAEKLYEAKLIDEQRLHRAQSMSDAALESLYDPVIVTDASARVVHLNRAGEDLYGLEKNVAGMSVSDIVRDDRIARAVDRAIGQERVYASEDESALILLKVGGSKRSYRLRVSPMRDGVGPILGAVAVLEDVTQLRELDRLKTEFISVASHELRTPVTSLLLSVQLLQEGAVGQLSLEQKQVIDAQREDLDRLEHLMRDLLDIARLEAGVMPPKFENVDPKDLAQTAIAELSSIAAAKGVRLIDNVPEELSSAWADRLQIGRVLVNLLSNAVRHTAADGTVSVAAREENEMIVFNVQDNGVGISPEYLPRIFDRFIQAPGAARGGAGLGLSLAKTIIKAHGGAIKATSELGAGTIFTFTLPMMAENSRKG
jgi:NtrC-family two-component system sensor histidine kinase KinB